MNAGLTVSQIRSLVNAGELTEAEGQEMIAERVAKVGKTASASTAAAAAPTAKKTTKKSESVAAPPSDKKKTKKEEPKKEPAKKETTAKKEEREERPKLEIIGATEVSKYCPREVSYCGTYGPNNDCHGFKLGKHFMCYDLPTWEKLCLDGGPFENSSFADFVLEHIYSA